MKAVKEQIYSITGLDKTQMLLIHEGLEMIINRETYHPDTLKKLNELNGELENVLSDDIGKTP